MSDPYNLGRFIDAQDKVFPTALAELRAGIKQSHWMWFIFPQLAGLGSSPKAKFYGLRNRAEATAYLAHPLLGPRLREAVEALRPWAATRSAEQILGSIDALKLRSCLTVFAASEPSGLFAAALADFFEGPDEHTLALLAATL